MSRLLPNFLYTYREVRVVKHTDKGTTRDFSIIFALARVCLIYSGPALTRVFPLWRSDWRALALGERLRAAGAVFTIERKKVRDCGEFLRSSWENLFIFQVSKMDLLAL